MEHLIEYSSQEMRTALEQGLDELNVFRYDGQYRDILGNAFIEKLTKWESQISHCKESPFTIAVVGDFKRGKSTLINALLGEEVVPTDVTTETVTLNRISFGVPGNEAILSGNRRVRLSDSELKREKLEGIMEELGEPIKRLEIKRPCEFLKKVTIIDTPGTGDSMRDFSEVVKESLLQADAVIYVYNVQYPLSKTEQMFLKAAILPQKYTSLFMVGNFGDVLGTKENYERMGAALKERVKSLLPDAKPYMISAFEELCRQTGEEREETELSGILQERFADLKQDLSQLIQARAEFVVVDRMQRLIQTMVKDLNAELDALEEGLHMSMEDIQDVIEEAERMKENNVKDLSQLLGSVDQVIKKMMTETNAWMGEFMQRIVQESRNLGNESNDDLKRYYEFYCVDLLQEAMNTCVEYHQECLLDLMDSMVEGISKRAVGELGEKKKYHFRISLDNRIWTKGDTVGLVASYVAPANFLVYVASIVTDGISGSMREKEKQKRVPELLDQISRKLGNMSAKITETVESVYQELGEKAKKLFTDCYEEQLKETAHLLDQTASAAAKSAEEKAAMKEVIERARNVLNQTEKAFG